MSVAYRSDGRGDRVVVLSNSLGTTTAMWDTQVASLIQHLRVIRYDHPGHGESPQDDLPDGVASLGNGVVELLDRLGLERVSFCGLSLGGAVGMWLAANAPGRIDRLVLACTSTRFGEPQGWFERAQAVREGGVAVVAEAVLGRWFTPGFAAQHPDTVARFRSMLRGTPREAYARCCEAIAGWDFSDLGLIGAPTLVLAGADDPVSPPEHARGIRDGIGGARLTMLPRAAHIACVEQPAAFADAVAGHLRRVEAA